MNTQKMKENKYESTLGQSSRFSLGNHVRNETQMKKYKQTLKTPFNGLENVEQRVSKSLQSFLLERKVYKLWNALKNHRGRHFAIDYRPQFGFSQYWEDDKKYKIQQANNLQYFQYPHWWYYLIALFILTSKVCIMWMVSVHRLFDLDGEHQIGELLAWAISTLIIDSLLKYKLFTHYEYFKPGDITKYLKSYWRDVIILVYFSTYAAHFSSDCMIFLFMDFAIVILLSSRCKQLMRCMRLQLTSSEYKNVYDLSQLFMMLLPIAHMFSLVLYAVAQCNDQHNWLIAKGLDHLNPIDKYIYSLYFTLTTMLTVGYGDITPVSIPEIIVVMLVQIIGIVTYGYIISSIGNIINYMRLEDEVLARDISTMSKMAKYYDIDKSLVQKAKNYLVYQKKQRATLTPQQQQSTLTKLHDDLRQQISKKNALKIVKSSLFYVCNWTKTFQLQIAKKLHKKIFTPNEQILQTPGKERLYVFKRGKVEIHADHIQGYKKQYKKILRTIEPNQTMQVSDNIYGYSFLLSNTPIKLSAISKQFVVAYFVQKKDFLQTVMERDCDAQYYFQMKTKIDTMAYPESWQAPLIINTKQHYFPYIQYLIVKEKKRLNKYKNTRSTKVDLRRFRDRTKRVLYRNCDDLYINQYSPQVIQVANRYIESQSDPYVNKSDKVIASSKTEENAFYSTTTWVTNSLMNDGKKVTKENLHFLLEQGKQFTNYFKRSNRTNVLSKLQKSNKIANKQQSRTKSQEQKKSTILLNRNRNKKFSTKSTQ